MINTKNRFKELHNEADDNTIEALYLLNDYRGSSYICDAISERADSMVDVYTYDLLEWAKTHISEIDEAADELGMPNTDNAAGSVINALIMQAQYLVNSRNLYDGLNNAVILQAWSIASERVEEVTEDQADKLNALDAIIDNNNRISDIEDEVKQILNIEE